MKKHIEEMAKVTMKHCEIDNQCGSCEYETCNECLAETLYNADYRKQRHGTWYHGTENGVVYAKCSACGRKMNYSCYGYAYCPECGAKMKGGAE